MNNKRVIVLIFISSSLSSSQAADLKLATVCSGATVLNNGSIVTLGQPFVGVASAPSGTAIISTGLVPALLQDKSGIGTVSITPSFSSADGHFQLNFPTQPGRSYILQASTNLTSWAPIWTNLGTWSGLTFEDPFALGFPQRFFKVVAP